MPGSRASTIAARSASLAGPTTCSWPGAPGPNACWTSAYPCLEASVGGTTLIDGIPVSSPTIGKVKATRIASAPPPKRMGRRHSRSAQRANAGERCSPECTQRSAPLSTRGPSFASVAGSRVSDAARMKTTDSMIPSAIDRKAGLGTSITAESETRTVTPEKSTALPAVSIVTATASIGSSFEPKWAPRKRLTMNSA
jgi:hypothetical protein